MPKAREGDLLRIFGEEQHVPPIRSGIKAPDGWIFLEGDFESAETYTLGYIADDPVLKKDLNFRGSDGKVISLHSIGAVNYFKLDMTVEEYEKERKGDSIEAKRLAGLRIAAKTVNFGIPYGRGGPAISRQIQRAGVPCSTDDGCALVEAWHDRYKVASKYLQFCQDSVENPGYIRTPWGRCRHFVMSKYQDVNAAMRREASNFPKLVGEVKQGEVGESLSMRLYRGDSEPTQVGIPGGCRDYEARPDRSVILARAPCPLRQAG